MELAGGFIDLEAFDGSAQDAVGVDVEMQRGPAASSYRADHTGQSARCTTVTMAVPPSQPRTR